MSAGYALLIFIAALGAYTAACYFIFRWIFAAQLMNWADHMEPYYKRRFIAGIRYAAGIVDGTAHTPEGMREDPMSAGDERPIWHSGDMPANSRLRNWWLGLTWILWRRWFL